MPKPESIVAAASLESESGLVVLPDAELIDPRTPTQMAGINISGDTVVLKTAHLPEDQRNLIRWAYYYAKDQSWTWKETARELGVSGNALYRVWTDRYRHPETDDRIKLDGICRELAKAKGLLEARAAIHKIPFTETSIWQDITQYCTNALIWQTVAMIYGEEQTGKTTCFIEHQRRNNHGTTKYVRVPAACGVQYFLRKFADACKVPSNKGIEVLRERIQNAIDGSTLVIIDELHEIFLTYSRSNILRTLAIIREIKDRTNCGMVLCGTRVWRDELEKGDFTKMLRQLRCRGILELQLPDRAPAKDLDLFAAQYGLPPATGQARELIIAINKEHGLGRYTKFLAMAHARALKRKTKYSWDDFRDAYKTLASLKD